MRTPGFQVRVLFDQWDCLLFDLISNLSQILNYLPLGKLVSGFGLCQPSKFSFFSRIGFICKNKVNKNAGGFIFFLKPEIEARIFWHRAGRPELEGTIERQKKFSAMESAAHQNPDVQHYMGGLVGQDMERNNGAGRVTNVPFMGSEMKMKGENLPFEQTFWISHYRGICCSQMLIIIFSNQKWIDLSTKCKQCISTVELLCDHRRMCLDIFHSEV